MRLIKLERKSLIETMETSIRRSIVIIIVSVVLCSDQSAGLLEREQTENDVQVHKSTLLQPIISNLATGISGKGLNLLSMISNRDLEAEVIDAALYSLDDDKNSVFEGRKKKYKKHEAMMITKMLMGLKIALLGVVLPLGVVAAQILSWKAVTLSLLAYMLAKIVFVKNLFMTKSAPTIAPATAPPPAPIIIHGSPSHESVWKRNAPPKIHLQPEVHVHQGHDDHATPAWTWAEEGRAVKDPHTLAFGEWAPKVTPPSSKKPKD